MVQPVDTRTRLRNLWIEHSERTDPVHFAGRHGELQRVLVGAPDRPVAGNTIIVQGAPGAGKTALLREAARRYEQMEGRRALFLGDPWEKDEERSTLQAIAQKAFGLATGAFASTTASTKTAKGSVGAIGGSLSRTEQTPPVELASWGDLVNRFGGHGVEAHPTLILVDESQNFSPDAGRLLRSLHAQQHFPFTLVCGGLSDTRNRLRDLGISRLSSDAELRVGALAVDEGGEAILQTLLWTLERCTAPPVLQTAEQVERWADALARRALGWPQHLACCIRGAWRALAETERPDLGDERSLRAALEYGDEMCQRYYDGRVEASRTDPSVILAVHRALTNGGYWRDVHRATGSAVDRLSEDDAAIHRHNHPNGTIECVRAMLAAGVIAETGDAGQMAVPIPSLTAHVERLVSRRRLGPD